MDLDKGKVVTVGLRMPRGFDTAAYNRVHELAGKKGERHPENWRHYGSAWNAVAYRFLAAAESDEMFRMCMPQSTEQEMYQWHTALFSFFASVVSCVECSFHAVYAIATMVDSNAPPFDDNSLRLYPKQVAKKLQQHFRLDPVGTEMAALLSTPEYTMIDEQRELLFHRVDLPRKVNLHLGRPEATTTTVPSNPKSRSSTWKFNLQVTPDTTSSRLGWLTSQLSMLFRLTESFCINHP